MRTVVTSSTSRRMSRGSPLACPASPPISPSSSCADNGQRRNRTKDFVARRHKVYHALIWLKGNNQYYRDISIDANAACRRTAPSRGCRQGRRPQPTTTWTRTQDLDRERQREGKKSWSPFCRRQRGKLCLKTQPSSLCYAKTTGRVATALSQCHGQTWRTWRSTTSKLQASPPWHSLRCFHTARGTQLTPSAAGQ